MNNTQRVVLNAAALYGRVIVTTVLGLFTSRLVLSSLGIEGFGIYSVTAGIMGFMAFLNGAMATSSTRHLTHELGRGDQIQLNRIFKTAFVLHAALALLLAILAETIGLWFLTNILQIPEARQNAAFWIYQFTVIATICGIMAVPYQALLTAHESLIAVAVTGTTQSLLGFVLALCIIHAPGDRLIFYVIGSSGIAILMTIVQVQLCRIRYKESRLRTSHQMNRQLTGELLGFSGWSLFGTLAVVCRLQGLAFLLNIFFGPAINAAYGIANQVSGMVYQFTQSMLQAISPRLIKQEGAGNRERMLDLSNLVCKYSFFIACIFAVPLFVEMETVLHLWLKSPPEHTVSFCRIILLMFLFDQLSIGFISVVLAVGKLAWFQMCVGLIHLATIPIAYSFLKFGYNQNYAMVASLLTVVLASILRPLLVKKISQLSYKSWLKNVIGRCLAVIIPVCICGLLIHTFIPSGLSRLLITTLTLEVTLITCILLIGISKIERTSLKQLASSFTKFLHPRVIQ